MDTKTKLKTDLKTELFLNKENLKPFINTFKVLNKYLTEANLTINEDGLKLVKIDNASICLFDITINKSFFIEYNIKEPITISFNIKEFLNALKEFKEVLKISITEKDIKLSDTKRVFSINLTDTEPINQNIPTLEYKGVIPLKDFKEFFKAIKTFAGFTDYVGLEAEKDFNINFEANKTIIKEAINLKEKVKSRFSIDYLKGLSYLKDYSGQIYLNNEYPLSIYIEHLGLKFNYILAPRVDTD